MNWICNMRGVVAGAGLTAALALAGCAVPGSKPVAGGDSGAASERWHNVQAGQPQGAEQSTGSAVFIRESAVAGPAANIFVNGDYLTSLQPGAFKQSTVCAGSNRLTAHFTQVGTRNDYDEKTREGQQFDVPAGQVSYFRVVPNGQGALALQRLTAEQAAPVLALHKEQVHTVPRVTSKGCTPVTAIKSYTIAASALFKFDRGDRAGLLPQAQGELSRLAADIAAQKVALDRVEVIGHTDPEGSADYNQRLSQERAQTVAQALATHGLSSQLFRAQGKGEQQLLVSDCRAKHPKNKAARMACDQPNRRVEVVVYGRKPSAN